MRQYVLNDAGEPVRCDDLQKWAAWFETADVERIDDDYVTDEGVTVRVSTIFIGLDMGMGRGAPVLWETMIFGGDLDRYQRRYTTLADARAGHREALSLVMQDAAQALPGRER